MVSIKGTRTWRRTVWIAIALLALVGVLSIAIDSLVWRWHANRAIDHVMADDGPLFPKASSHEQCDAKAGQWARYTSDPARGICIIPTPDAGRECSSRNECATFCVVKVGPEPLTLGDEVIGQCHDSYQLVGLHRMVEGGRYVADIWID